MTHRGTTFSAQFGFSVLAGVITGLIVWWVILVVGGVASLGRTLLAEADLKSIGTGALLGLAIGIVGSMFASTIGAIAGGVCAPAAIALVGYCQRRGRLSAGACIVGGALSAVATANVLAVLIWAIAQLHGTRADFMPLLGGFNLAAIGGPIGGYVFWRLARKDLLQAQAAKS